MSWLLLSFLAALSLVMLLRGLLVPGRFYHFPFFAAGIFLLFIIPQIPGLIDNRFIDQETLQKTLFFSVLCLGACWLGWSLGVRSRGVRDFAFSEERLLTAAAAMALIGAYFFYQFSQLPDEVRLRGILTGTAVAYMFFAKLLTYGLAIALICYARHPSKLALAIILFCAVFYFERIVIAGRRGEMADLLLLIALAFWFQRGWAAPRVAVLAGLALVVIGLMGAGQYRDAVYYREAPEWSSVLSIDVVANWNQLIRDGGPEMTNAVMAIRHAETNKEFDLGASHWNSLVFAYVPAQIVGQPLKNSLMLDDIPPKFDRDYEPPVGSTSTGMTDAFASFWYFGSAKFLLIGWLMAWIYAAAARGNTVMQIVYMLSAVPSILAITHFTNELLNAWIHMAAFVGPALYYARMRSPAPQPVPQPAGRA